MTTPLIVERARAIAALPGFDGPDWWLTFYLAANPASLVALTDRLSAMGAVNLDGAEGGISYPKLRVSSDPQSVVNLVTKVQDLAAECDVQVSAVDVDTSPQVGSSLFEELVGFERASS